MVIVAGEAEEDRHKMPLTAAATAATLDENFTMAMVPVRSTNLHNFSSLPCFNVKWGRQKQLRCVKPAVFSDQDYPTSSSSPLHHQRRRFPPERKRRSTVPLEDDGGIEAMREKLMFDLRSEVHQMKAAILSGDDVGTKTNGEVGGEVAVTATEEARPWNLRTRRAVCKDPYNNDSNNGNAVAGDREPSLLPARHTEVKSPLKSGGDLDGDGGGGYMGPRAKFSACLSKREIEMDFLEIMGIRPARRAKKRSKYVQKQIDTLFPGYWLSEINADMYKVDEDHER